MVGPSAHQVDIDGVKLFAKLGRDVPEIARLMHTDEQTVQDILNDRPRQLTLAWEVLP